MLMRMPVSTQLAVASTKKSVKLSYEDTGAEVDYLVIAGGRRADVEALHLAEAGFATAEDGKIDVDAYQRTSTAGLYAIGGTVRRTALFIEESLDHVLTSTASTYRVRAIIAYRHQRRGRIIAPTAKTASGTRVSSR